MMLNPRDSQVIDLTTRLGRDHYTEIKRWRRRQAIERALSFEMVLFSGAVFAVVTFWVVA